MNSIHDRAHKLSREQQISLPEAYRRLSLREHASRRAKRAQANPAPLYWWNKEEA